MGVSDELKTMVVNGGGFDVASPQVDLRLTDVRYVAFLDMMGFKDKVARHNHCEILDDLRELSDFIISQHPNEKAINYAMFSDSLLFYTKSDDKWQLHELTQLLADFILYAIGKRIPMKGAIQRDALLLIPKNNCILDSL